MRVQQHTNDQFLRFPTPMNQNEVSLATRTLGESSFPFLELPREIRDQIYGYLLSNKYTKCIDEGRRDYYNTDNHIMHGIIPLIWPTHRFRSHPNILQANRQINHEGSIVLYEENLFVHIIGWNLDVRAVAKAIGLESVQGLLTGACKHSACSVKIFADPLDHVLDVHDDNPTSQCVIASDDLETFCQSLSCDFVSDLFDKISRRMLPKTVIDVTINPSISSKTAQHRLLNPLRTLHGLRKLRINGSVDPQLCAYVVSQATTEFPDWKKVVDIVRIRTEEGNHAFRNGNTSLAIAKYKEALKYQLGARRQGLPSIQLMYNVSTAYMRCGDWIRAVKWTLWTFNLAKCRPNNSYLQPNSLIIVKITYRYVLARLQFRNVDYGRFGGEPFGVGWHRRQHECDHPDEELSLLLKHLRCFMLKKYLGGIENRVNFYYELREIDDLPEEMAHMRDPETIVKISAAASLWEGPELLNYSR